MDPWLISLLVGLVLNVVSYLLLPKPKQNKPESARNMDDPTAEAGREIPVVFGTMTVQSLNVLWYGDKTMLTYKVNA
jgi:hypothetical protein